MMTVCYMGMKDAQALNRACLPCGESLQGVDQLHLHECEVQITALSL